MENVNQKKAGVIITYLTMGLRVLIGFAYTPFMLAKVGDSQYGVYTLSLSLISFISLLDLGFGQTLVRYIAKSRALEDQREEAKLNGFFLKLYSAIALIALIVGLAVVYLYPLLSKKVMLGSELRLFKAVFLILLVDTVISFPMCVFSANLNAYERFFYMKAVDLITLIVKYLLMTLLLIFGRKVFAVTLASSLLSISVKMVNGFYCKKKINIHFCFDGFQKEKEREIFLFSFFIFVNLIIDFLYNSTDTLILGAIRGTFAVTTYSFGIYFQTYFQELSTALSGVFMPRVVYLYEHDRDLRGMSDLFLKVGRLQMILLFLALSGFLSYGQDFIRLWVGDKYADAYIIGLLIMVPSIIPLSQNIGISVLRAMNLHKHRSYMYLFIAFLNVVISIPLAQKYSGIGAALGTCIACIAGQILFMNYYYSKKIGLDIKQYWKNFLTFAAASAPLAAAAYLLKKAIPAATWGTFAIHVVLYTAAYGILIWFFVSNDYEKDLVRNLLDKIRRART